jgi:GAF domain-containing protein
MTERTGVLSDLERMRTVASYDLFNPRLTDELRVVCRRTATRVGVPLAAVQAVLDTATACIATNTDEHLLSRLGGAPNEFSMCPTVVVTGEAFVAADLREIPRFAGTPGVLSGLIRAYAGVPLTSDSGAVIGSHCVMSPHERPFTEQDVEGLFAAAAEVMEILSRYRSPDCR